MTKRTDPNQSYIYLIYVDGIVRYIGKGRGGRSIRHFEVARSIIRAREAGQKPKTSKFYNKLISAMQKGLPIESVIISEMMSCSDAYELESELISDHVGEELWNTAQGGRGLTSEAAYRVWEIRKNNGTDKLSDEVREKMRLSSIAKYDRLRAGGKPLQSAEARRKKGESIKIFHINRRANGTKKYSNDGLGGIRAGVERRYQRRRDAGLSPISDETRLKRNAAIKAAWDRRKLEGSVSPSEETRRKISETLLRRRQVV
jgi:hypothetical protein